MHVLARARRHSQEIPQQSSSPALGAMRRHSQELPLWSSSMHTLARARRHSQELPQQSSSPALGGARRHSQEMGLDAGGLCRGLARLYHSGGSGGDRLCTRALHPSESARSSQELQLSRAAAMAAARGSVGVLASEQSMRARTSHGSQVSLRHACSRDGGRQAGGFGGMAVPSHPGVERAGRCVQRGLCPYALATKGPARGRDNAQRGSRRCVSAAHGQ